MKRKKFKPGSWQRAAARFILKREGAGMFADPGMRKTSTSLYVYKILKRAYPQLRALVIAPLPAILNTWPEEIEQWDIFEGITYYVAHGKEKEKWIDEDKDICLLNTENISWLFEQILDTHDVFPFHMLIIDESTLFKNTNSVRFDVLSAFRPYFRWCIALTGTPTAGGLMDLFAQMWLIDMGKTLGSYVSHFKRDYFDKSPYSHYVYYERKDTLERLQKAIAPSVIRIDRSDYIDMPEIEHVVVRIELEKKEFAVYKQMERLLFTEMDGKKLLTKNELTKYQALRQLANGGLYETPSDIGLGKKRICHSLHNRKMEHLKNILDELNGKPCLCSYQFQFQLDQMNSVLKQKFPILGSGSKSSDIKKYKKKWLDNKLPLLVAHPRTVSHSLNLQYGAGRHIVWTAVTDYVEQVQQFNERIYRPGVNSGVKVFYLVGKDTIEEGLLERNLEKEGKQKSLMRFLKSYGRKKGYY